MSEENQSKATAIMGLFWENFLKSEPAFIMRDVIAIEMEKAVSAERGRCIAIINAARSGEVDQDLRSIRSMIECGWPLDKILNAATMG